MRAVEYHANNDVRVVEVPRPTIGPGELLVQVRACGICGSDVMEWYMRPRAPLFVGHEPAGVVVEVGAGVDRFAPGDRVFVHHHVPCLVCHFCRRGSFSQCPTFRATRLDPGGLAEYVRVPAVNASTDVLKLPERVSFEEGALVEPLACCVRSIQRCGIRPGDTVVVLGAGQNGLMHAQLSRIWGATRVVVLDPISWRRERALSFGADHVLDPGAEDAEAAVRAVNEGRLADVVVVTASKIPAIELGVALCGPGGTVMIYAPPAPGERLAVEPNHLFFREITLMTSYSAGPYDTRLALDLIASRRVDLRGLITHRFPLEQAAAAFALTAQPGDALKAMVVMP